MKYRKGFSLFELLMTLCILAIISSFAFPAFNFLIEKEKSIAISYSLFHHLSYARTEAISKNITVSLCARNDNMGCSANKNWSNQHILIFTDQNSNGKREPDDTILRDFHLNLNAGTLLWKSFGNKNYLQWQPSGMTFYQNGNFTYCPKSKDVRNAKKIILNAAGRIYFGQDTNHDGIQEGTDGKNILCT